MRNWRLNLLLILFLGLGVLLLIRLFSLQISKNDFYSALAQGQQNILEAVLGPRGKIFCHDKKNLIPLAINLNSDFCYVIPFKIPQEKREEVAQSLSQILNLDEEQILEKLENESFIKLKENLSESEVQELRKIRLPEVYVGKELLRSYPEKFLASHVIGFLGADQEGKYGIESFYEDILKGKESFQKGERGNFGYIFFPKIEEVAGKDLVLTLDYNIQYQAEKLLQEAKEQLSIEGGQILVMNPETGAILTLAEFPNFDPNEYSKWSEDMEVFKSKVVQDLFEPGSVFKPITMAAALNEGKVTPETTYYDTGQVKVPGGTIYNYNNAVWGERTMTEVLEISINTGAVFVEKKLGHENFLDYIERFGIFEETGIDSASEAFSENKEFKKGYEINFATASFGQGIQMTPIQLARAFAAVANGGKLIWPHLVEEPSFLSGSYESEEVIFQETASKLTEMLVSVVENGFAKRAKVPGYYIAGKTGTAEVPFEHKRGYYKDRTIQTFVGFFPAFNPQFLVLIKLDNPRTKTAEYSAVPLFQKMAKYIIDYSQIPPDYE